MWQTFLIFLHIAGAIALFGPTFTFPFFGVVAQKKDGDPRTLLRLMDMILKYLVIPADYLMPLSGTLLILNSKGAWDPFASANRWLLASIILFTIMWVLATFVQLPAHRKALKLANAGQFGPEFGALMAKQAKIGPILGLLLTIIIVLMTTKPGSGFIHP